MVTAQHARGGGIKSPLAVAFQTVVCLPAALASHLPVRLMPEVAVFGNRGCLIEPFENCSKTESGGDTHQISRHDFSFISSGEPKISSRIVPRDAKNTRLSKSHRIGCSRCPRFVRLLIAKCAVELKPSQRFAGRRTTSGDALCAVDFREGIA